MSKTPATLTLQGNEPHQHVSLSNIQHLGNGAYTCNVSVEASGFTCHKAFSFDNDEYFLSKLRGVLSSQSGEAELLDLQSDNYLKIQAYESDRLLVSGLILESLPFSQSLEFAFTTSYDRLERFTGDFSHMVQANI